MTSEQFMWWLQGYLVGKETLTQEQVAFVNRQLQTTLTPQFARTASPAGVYGGRIYDFPQSPTVVTG